MKSLIQMILKTEFDGGKGHLGEVSDEESLMFQWALINGIGDTMPKVTLTIISITF